MTELDVNYHNLSLREERDAGSRKSAKVKGKNPRLYKHLT